MRIAWFKIPVRLVGFSLVCLAAGFAAFATTGCSKPKESAPSVSDPPSVQIVQPQLRNIVPQGGSARASLKATSSTSIYPKVTGYIEEWKVDIGDKVKKGNVLCTLFVPELKEDWQTKKETVQLDKQRGRSGP